MPFRVVPNRRSNVAWMGTCPWVFAWNWTESASLDRFGGNRVDAEADSPASVAQLFAERLATSCLDTRREHHPRTLHVTRPHPHPRHRRPAHLSRLQPQTRY